MNEGFVASLGMYDFPWTAAANDAVWGAVAERLRRVGIEAPRNLWRGVDLNQIWRGPKLLFGQTCGYPYVASLRGAATLIATPVYAFPGCDGASHSSVIIASKRSARRALADFAGARAAVNAHDSNTGMNLFRATIAPIARGRPFFGRVIVTGSHEASMIAVSEGEADIAAIDCVSFALLRQGRPELAENIEPIGRSPRAPGLPFIMSASLAASCLVAVRTALFAALSDAALATARETIGIVGAEILADADYERVAKIERDAIEAGYPTLA